MCSRNCIVIIVIINLYVSIVVAVVCQVNKPIKCKYEISDSSISDYSFFFILFCYTKLRTNHM